LLFVTFQLVTADLHQLSEKKLSLANDQVKNVKRQMENAPVATARGSDTSLIASSVILKRMSISRLR